MQPYYLLQRGKSEKLLIADTESESNEIDFETEFVGFKISPVSTTGIPGSVDISLLANGKIIQDRQGNIIQMTYSGDFVWTVLLDVPIRKVSIRFSAPATDDLVFQITAYGTDPH